MEQQTETLGELVARHRRSQNRSARSVAREADIDIATMTRLEKGTYTSPSPITLKGLSRALGIPILELFHAAGYITPYDLMKMIDYVAGQPAMQPVSVDDVRSQYLSKLIEDYGLDYDGSTSDTNP